MSNSAPTPEHPCVHAEGHPACRSYHPGHNAHYIQARLASGNQDRWVRVDLGAPHGNTVQATFPDGSTRTWWCHDPALLERFHTLQHSGAAASFDPGTSLATVPSSQDRLALLHPAVVEGQ